MTDGKPDKPKKKRGPRPAGQIVKRGEKKYLIRISLGRDETTRKRQYHNKTFRGTRTDAQKWLTMALRRRDMGEPIEDTDRSVSDWLDEWLKLKAKSVRPRTLEIYTENIERHIKPAIGKRKLATIVPGDIQKLYTAMIETGRWDAGRLLPPGAQARPDRQKPDARRRAAARRKARNAGHDRRAGAGVHEGGRWGRARMLARVFIGHRMQTRREPGAEVGRC